MRVRLASSLVVGLLSVAITIGACSNESEGQPCSTANGNDDCNDGLVCVKPPNAAATNAPTVCCPQDLSQATTTECSVPSFTLGDGSTAAPETSTSGDGPAADVAADSSSDAATDGATDSTMPEASGSEASGDAPADAVTGQ
jgi:hypothetical protein